MKFGDQYAGEDMIRAAGKRYIRVLLVKQDNPMLLSDLFWQGARGRYRVVKALRWRVRDCATKS